MAEEINPSELGAFTNNLPNKEGIKKLVSSLEGKQEKLTAGSNVAISDENVISATDTKYTAGDNVQISEQNVISATDTKYTAGTGISISEENVISASGDSDGWTEYTSNSDAYTDFTTHGDIYEFGVLVRDGSASSVSRKYYFGTFTTDNLVSDQIICCQAKEYAYANIYTVQLKVTISNASSLSTVIVQKTLEYSNSSSNIANVKLYDFDTGLEIQISDISQYIDSTTYKCIKKFYLMFDNRPIPAIALIGCEEIEYFTSGGKGSDEQNGISPHIISLQKLYNCKVNNATYITTNISIFSPTSSYKAVTNVKYYKRPRTRPIY